GDRHNRLIGGTLGLIEHHDERLAVDRVARLEGLDDVLGRLVERDRDDPRAVGEPALLAHDLAGGRDLLRAKGIQRVADLRADRNCHDADLLPLVTWFRNRAPRPAGCKGTWWWQGSMARARRRVTNHRRGTKLPPHY